MLTVLRFIGDGIALIGQMVAWGAVTTVNAVIAAIGALISLVVALLPDLPPAPQVDSEILGLFAWLFPLGAMAAFFLSLITLYGVFLLAKVALNWAKAL